MLGIVFAVTACDTNKTKNPDNTPTATVNNTKNPGNTLTATVSDTEDSPNTDVPTSMVGTWKREEDMMRWVRGLFAYDAHLGRIAEKVEDNEFLLEYQLVFDETTMKMSASLIESEVKEFTDAFYAAAYEYAKQNGDINTDMPYNEFVETATGLKTALEDLNRYEVEEITMSYTYKDGKVYIAIDSDAEDENGGYMEIEFLPGAFKVNAVYDADGNKAESDGDMFTGNTFTLVTE